jgi:hypothetical protein
MAELPYVLARTALARRVYFTGKGKKPEVGEKRVYRISQKFFGFVVFLSDKNLKKKSSIYTKTA